MQSPPTPATEEAVASIPTENARDSPNLNHAVRSRRKAAKRSLPWNLVAGELHLVSPPARKKQRLEEPLSVSTDEVSRKTASFDVSAGLPPAGAADVDDTNADSVTDRKPNVGATGRWTLEEDAELTRAIANTPRRSTRITG
jgi:hypothetical protein